MIIQTINCRLDVTKKKTINCSKKRKKDDPNNQVTEKPEQVN